VDPSLLTRWTSPQGWGGKLGGLVECFDTAAVPRATTDLTTEFERWRAASVRSDVALERD
jgi:hypothetical protein